VGIWGFNPSFVMGIWILKLPLEEWLFFIVVPYACYFIYAVINFYYPRIIAHKFFFPLHGLLVLLSYAVGIIFIHKTYTAVAFLLASLVLFVSGKVRIIRQQLPRYYTAFFVSLIPFLMINGILTALPVVTYNDAENLGIRLFTIPAEDIFYLLSLLFINFALIDTFTWQWKKD
jgi:lycopene cyclase domain-containing protein